MSVRRLAEPAEQPAAFAFKGDLVGESQRWISKYPQGRQQSAIIPLLMLAQEQEGWVTKAAIEHIADMLAMPYIRALEVATFYTQFQLKPVGTRAHIQVCGTTPCMLRGAEALMDVCRSKIHHDQFHRNDNGTLSWEEVECLGACVNAPMVMVFKDTYEDLTPERLGEIIDSFERGEGAGVPVGPQVSRNVSAPQGGLTSLNDEKALLKSVEEWRDARKSADEAAVAAAAEAARAKAAEEGNGGAPVPPTQAAKPKTDAPETNAATKSPSATKAPPAAEAAAGISAPKHDEVKANQTAAAVEGETRQRKRPSVKAEAAPFASPELIKGDPVGASGKKVKSEQPSLEDKARPAGIERPTKPDDLKMISGVGPKNEAILHSLGIYTFAQVALWKKAEREWVDGYLRFGGRVEREGWVKQAKALAKGEAEYIRVFGKKPV